MLARSQLRSAALAALQAAHAAGTLPAAIFSPGDWAVTPGKLPALLLRCGTEHKTSNAKSNPFFTTSVPLEIKGMVVAPTAEGAQAALETLGDQVEQALFTSIALIQLVQQVAEVTTESRITAEGKEHFGEFGMSVVLECVEQFNPTIDTPLASVGIHFDLADPFDANGTYPAPTSPQYTPAAAPRPSGPDGRDEGALDLTLPQ